ncbi:MAG: electron transfer flavoprotein subunit alpha/FixB family protein [Devosia sp.]
MRTLLVAEHRGGRLDVVTAQALTAALALGGEVDVLVAGAVVSGLATAATRLSGISRVLAADNLGLAHQAAAPLAALIVSLAGEYDAIVAPASSSGKDVMPRVAALLDVMQIPDVVEVLGPDTFRRPIYAGNAIETVRSHDAKKVITVRTSAFAAAPMDGRAGVVNVVVPSDPRLGRVVSETQKAADRPDLASARVVISGGRALGSKSNFDRLLMPLAEKLGAAVGASRAAVDAGYAASELQVGQTGRIVAPDLYIAIGISGAIQHLAGMKGSKVIVAINSDASAPIFSVADYGLVGDLFEIVPELTKAL